MTAAMRRKPHGSCICCLHSRIPQGRGSVRGKPLRVFPCAFDHPPTGDEDSAEAPPAADEARLARGAAAPRHAHGHQNVPPARFSRCARALSSLGPRYIPKKQDHPWGTLRKEGAPMGLLYLNLICSLKRCNPCGYAVFSLLRWARCCWKASSISSGVSSWRMPTPL